MKEKQAVDGHPASAAKKEQAAPVRSRRLWMALVLGTLSAFGPLSLDMYLPALPQLAGDLNTSASAAQLSLTACLLGLALGQLAAGPLSDMYGRRKPLLTGLLLFAAVSVLCMLSASASAFVALRFIQGLAGAAGIVISRAIARDLYAGTELTKFFALLMLVNGAAPILAPIFGGQLLAFTTWRGVFLALALIGVLALAAVILALPETLPPQRRMRGGLRETWSTFGRLVKDRSFMGYALSQGFVTAAMFAYIAGSPFVLQNIYGVSPQGFSLIFAANGLGIIMASQATGRLAGRFSESRLLITGLILAAASGLLVLTGLAAGAGLAWILPPLFVAVSCVGIVGTASFPLAMAGQSQAAGSASALLGVLSFIFGGLVAPLVGLGGESSALPLGIVMAVSNLIALVLYGALIGRFGTSRA
ncbi:MFS transporter, DHA1 family, bicyclomycin/chloramphenicol resistance protein [Paenibacillus sp. UNCCL117]|nr:MFS transporter, DHA1 family, bicyclomycin/chloramphenicol resistance protein [Paenibacillus sp. cl123]SFW33909.1 MFS transporter, DHA1 family, bicyclomycin/chloramphenicol resistance protein [Paenibacillus sp. UNCCL117]